MAKKRDVKNKTVALEKLEVVWVPIDKIRPNPYNPNHMNETEFEMLKQSIVDDGFTTPIIVRTDDEIVDGEHRWLACKDLGYTEIGIVYVNMDEVQRRISTIRHNKARGTHSIEQEAAIIRDLQKLNALNWAQESLHMSDAEVNRLLTDFTPVEVFGSNEQYGQAWDYSKAGTDPAGNGSASESAVNASKLPSDPVERRRMLEQMGMEEGDVTLERRNITMTQSESKLVKEVLGDKAADTLVAIAQAQAHSQNIAGKGEWTTVTFTIPTAAITIIFAELERLERIAPNVNRDLAINLQRGLALEFMAVLSSQTPETSLK